MAYYYSYKKVSLVTITFLIFVIASCNKKTINSPDPSGITSNDVGVPPPIIAWVRGNDLPIVDGIQGDVPFGRAFPFAFTINGKAYYGGGMTITGWSTGEHGVDTWEFDPTTQTWSQKADFPGAPFFGPATFVLDNKGYVCTGETWVSGLYSKENWRYDPATNIWTRKADFGGTIHGRCTGMALAGKGYVGLGVTNVAAGILKTKDWWQYDSNTDTWTKKTDFPGGKREGAAGFVINDKGYVCGGFGFDDRGNNIWYNDCWRYNPATDTWTQRADLPALGRQLAASYSANGLGIISGGQGQTILSGVIGAFNDCWQYNPANNSWSSLPNVGGGGRYAAASFSIGNTLYVGGGTSDFYTPSANKKDAWSLTLSAQ